jgi:hypothetical protein
MKWPSKEMVEFLTDVLHVLKKHKGKVGYNANDDGVHLELLDQDFCAGFISHDSTLNECLEWNSRLGQ